MLFVFTVIRQRALAVMAGLAFFSLPAGAQVVLSPVLDADGAVNAAGVLPDGGMMVGGAFGQLGGESVPRIGRSDPDGAVLPFFAPSPNFDAVDCLLQLGDGRLLIGGSSAGGMRSYLLGVRADGTIDRTFNARLFSPIRATRLLAGGDLLVAGEFFSPGESPFSRLVRLGPDGARDESFSPSFSWQVTGIDLHSDGRIVVCGEFNHVNGVARQGLARLHDDGTLDATLQITHDFAVRSVVVDAQQRIVAGGTFTQINDQPRGRMVRLLVDGSLDPDFQPAFDGAVETIVMLGDGGILAGGAFQEVNGQARRGIALLRDDGSLDPSFAADTDGDVRSLTVTVDGRVLVGGLFGEIAGVARSRFAVLGMPGAAEPELVPVEGGVDWRIPGTAAEMREVRLEYRAAHGWVDAGPGARTPAGWHFTTGVLPQDTWLRARGRSGGGWRNGSDFLAETTLWLGPADEPKVSVAFDGGQPLRSGADLTDFGTVAWPDTGAPRVLTIANTGATPLDGLEISSGIAGMSDFEITGSLAGSIPPGGSASVEVAFRPLSAGLRRGYLRMGGPPLADDFIVPLAGTGFHLDASFEATSDSNVRAFAVQPDGRILVGGDFSSINGAGRRGLARLHPDGSLDAAFTPSINNYVYAIAVQDGGGILIGGVFDSVGDQTRQCFARLLPDGTVDAGFSADANNLVRTIAIDRAGRILVGGSFTEMAGQTRRRLARFHADGTLDADFAPDFSGQVLCIQPLDDGGLLVGGKFSTVNGTSRPGIARINADGALESGFDLATYYSVRGIVRQPDGGFVLFGTFPSLGGQERYGMARIDANGTLDPDYRPSLGYDIESAVMDEQGRMILGLRNSSSNRHVVRLFADGSIDEAFDPKVARQHGPSVMAIALQNDGQLLIGGLFSSVSGVARSNLARVPNDGSAVSSLTVSGGVINWQRGGPLPATDRAEFATWNGTGWNEHGAAQRVPGGWRLEGLEIPAHSWVRARGRASGGQTNGSTWTIEQIESYGELLPDFEISTDDQPAEAGTTFDFGEGHWFQEGVSTSFTITNTGSAVLSGVTVTADPDFIVDGPEAAVLAPGESTTATVTFVARGVGPRHGELRISADMPVKSPWVASLTGQGIHLDPEFSPSVSGSQVAAIIQQTDGAVVIGGSFSSVDGTTRSCMARFSADGSLDAAFDPAPNSVVHALAQQADGRILVGGSFNILAGSLAARIGRLFPDGTRDPSFTTWANGTVRAIAQQPDGRILIGGSFSRVNGTSRPRLARLLTDGTLDLTFQPDVSGSVQSIVVQSDGRILIGGDVSSVNGITRSRIARLHADGSLDADFQPEVSSSVRALTVQPDGRVLLAGSFTSIDGVPRNRLARLHADGSLDTSFDPNASGEVRTLALQADGAILVGGTFSQIAGQSRARIARLRADGSLDLHFDPGADAAVNGIALAENGAVMVGGEFSAIGGVARARLARLPNNLPGERAFTRGPGARLEWRFSGGTSAPSFPGFDVWSGGEWSSLGDPVREGDAWILENAPLPANGWLRARALVSGASGNASSTFVEHLEVLGTENPEIELGWNDGPPLPLFAAAASLGSTDWFGEGVVHTLTITNRGGGMLDGLQITVSGSHAADLTVEPENPGPLAAGESAQVAVRFIPRGGGAREAMLTVRSNIPNPTLFSVGLSGTGIHVDPTFAPTSLPIGQVSTFVPRGNRGSFLGGNFSRGGGLSIRHLMAVDHVGANESTWPVRASSMVRCLVAHHDGAVTFGGDFFSLGGSGVVSRRRLARITPDFAQDIAFAPEPNWNVWAIHPLAAGELLVGGEFTSIGGVTRYQLAKLRPDGTPDPEFAPHIFGGTVRSIAMQSDGRIIVGGDFSFAGGLSRQRLARINPNGTGDATFVPPVNLSIECVAVLPDDRILVGGNFSLGSGNSGPQLLRFHSDGTLDPTFHMPTDGAIHTIAVQTDGALLVGGQFNMIGGLFRPHIARILADDTLDPDFNPTANNVVTSLALDADGRVLVGGNFTAIGGITTGNSAVRLPNNVAAAREMFFHPEEGVIEWLVGGSVPECLFVHFERWNGGGWSPLGQAARIPGGWRLENVALAESTWLRAVGVTMGGIGSASAGFIEHIHVFGDGLPEMVVEREDGSPLQEDTSFDFGTVAVGETAGIALRVRNAGGGTLDGLAATVMGSGNFTVSVPGNVSLAHGESAIVHLHFTPNAAASRTAVLRVFANDPLRSPAKFAAEGIAFHPPGTFGAWPVLAELPTGQRGPAHRHGPLQIPNLLAFAMDLHPMTATPDDLPTALGIDPSGAFAIFRYRRAKTLVGTTFTPETSSGLADWQPAEIADLEVIHEDETSETVIVHIPVDPENRLFFRMRAE